MDKAKTAVIVVDMLNDFVTGALKCDRGLAIVPVSYTHLKWAIDFSCGSGRAVWTVVSKNYRFASALWRGYRIAGLRWKN